MSKVVVDSLVGVKEALDPLFSALCRLILSCLYSESNHGDVSSTLMTFF